MSLAITKGVITLDNARIDLSNTSLSSDRTLQQAGLTQTLANRSIFGQDLLMFAEGDLFSSGTLGHKSDLLLVAGLFNYAQAITHRLMTTRGTMPGNPSFGVPWKDYIGRVYSNASALVTNLKQDITDEVYKDNRTQSVVSIDLNFVNPTTIQVELHVLPTNSQAPVGISLSVGNV